MHLFRDDVGFIELEELIKKAFNKRHLVIFFNSIEM